jgi:hypothetical protein
LRFEASTEIEERQMPAIIAVRIHKFGGIETLEVEDVEPSMPDATEILVKVRAASVNPVDFKIRSGKYPAVNEDGFPTSWGATFPASWRGAARARKNLRSATRCSGSWAFTAAVTRKKS